jgi:tetratricopeptide (TPR) repeat protein
MNVGTSLVAPARRPCPRCGGAGRARSGRPLRAVTVVALVTGAAGVGAAPVAEHAAPDVIAELVGQLGAGDYAVREIAAARLVELGGPAADALLTAAETSTDLEVALRARWLVEAMPATLGAAGDAPAAAALIDRFQAGDASERARSLLRLLRLDDDAGIAPLARIARLDRSMSLSRLAARLLVREWLPDDPFWPSVRRHVAAGVGTSGRPAARFLRALVAFSEAPADDERVRQVAEAQAALALVEGSAVAAEESDTESTDPDEENAADAVAALDITGNTDAVRDMRRCLCAMQVQAGLRDEALVQAARLFGMRDAAASRGAGRDAAIAEDLVWLTERGLPEAVHLLEHRWPGLEIDEPLTAYAAAVALAAAGDRRRSDALAERARDQMRLAPGGFPPRIRTALRLVRWGAVEWAIRDYDALLADPALPAEEFAWASILYSEFLHDQGRQDRAAEVLEPVIRGRPGRVGEEPERVFPRLDRDPRTATSRMLYFKACAAADRGATADQRRLLEEALQAHPRDVDALIALYRLPDASPQQRGLAQTLVVKALARIEEEIQAMPDDPNGYNEYAWLVSNTEGDVDKATRYSRRSLEASFDSPSYLDTLAHCHAAAGDFPRAVRTQSLARRFEPHNRTIERNLRRFQAGQR